MRSLLPFFAILVLPLSGQTASSTQSKVEEFSLPFFDAQGQRTAMLRGDAARSMTATEFTIEGLQFAHFVPAGQTRPETVLLSPLAHVVLEQRNPVISGPSLVRLIRSDLEASGEDWTYDHAGKRLTLRRAVRVTYSAELKELLP